MLACLKQILVCSLLCASNAFGASVLLKNVTIIDADRSTRKNFDVYIENGIVKSTGLAPTLDTLVNMQSNENTLHPSNLSSPQRDGNFTSPLR